MKYQKWNEKMIKKFDAMSEKNEIFACNVSGIANYYSNGNGIVFTTSNRNARLYGAWLLFIPGVSALSVKSEKCMETAKNCWIDSWNDKKAILVESMVDGKTKAGYYSTEKKCKKLTNKNGVSAFVDSRLFKDFPKNACYYVSDPKKPVLVGLWDNKQGILHQIGLVLPLNVSEYNFIPDEKEVSACV